MKRVILIFLIFLYSISIWSKIGPAVKLHFLSGNTITLLLEDQPLFQFENDEIIISTNKREIRCDFGELLKYTYVNNKQASIDNVQLNDARMFFSENGISGTNLNPNTEVSVYTQDGKFVCSALTNESGNVNINFQFYNNIVYIINHSSMTFKMIKK